MYWSVPAEELSLGSGTIILPDGEERGTRLRNFTKTDVVTQGVDAAFSFSGVEKIRRLTQVTITTTITNGATGPGEGNENDLGLFLDDINTGIKFNGFRDGQTDTQTNSGAPNNADAIVAALKEDGELRDEIGLIGSFVQNLDRISIPPNTESTLTITGKESAGGHSGGKGKNKGKGKGK